MIKSGIDTFKENPDIILKGRRFALITNSSNVDANGIPVYVIAKKYSDQLFHSIWSLQHGFFVDKQDNMILSSSFFWKEMDIHIKSLYGDDLVPGDDWLKGLDALVIDVFDVGTRVYTFLNHIVKIMKTLSGKGIDIIVLDRANPLKGNLFEGNRMEENYFSIVGEIPIPMRHGLTSGEFLKFAQNFHNIDLNLEIVKIVNWKREGGFKGNWTYPSPNMPTFNTTVVYPGAVMVEGTNLSEGRGTTRPFEFVGSPFLDNFKIIEELISLKLPGVVFIPTFFKPEFSKFADQVCKGIFVCPKNIREFRSFQTFYEIIRLVRHHFPENFKWKTPPYEFEYVRPPIDMICGSDFIRKSIEDNLPFESIIPQIDSSINEYKNDIEDFLIYK
jgi:uncharacterized protein YbbC (DUF1343 family)